MAVFESGRRLCLLFEAGRTRFAIEATSVVEVAPPDPEGKSIRGLLELKDLSVLLGGQPEIRPGMAIVLDVSPTLALRVRGILEVADAARAQTFQLPQGLGEGLAIAVRGALFHNGGLYLELAPDGLCQRAAAQAAGAPVEFPVRPVFVAEEPPDRALVFESQGRLFGIALSLVSQIVSSSSAFCPLPSTPSPIAGLFPHLQSLWPITSAPALLGAQAEPEPLFLLTELAGQSVGLCAARVLGVHQGFSAADQRGEFIAPGLPRPALFLDLQRMFS